MSPATGNLKEAGGNNDIDDPYQMYNIDYKENHELFSELCDLLRAKLEEADDIWFREGYMDKIEAKLQ